MHGPQRSAYDDAMAFLREEEANFAELPSAEVQPLRDLAESAHPYRGNALPVAKAAVAKLKGMLGDLLATEREQAISALDAQEGRLKKIDEYLALDEPKRQEVLAASLAAREAIQSARFVTGIRDRIQRYIAHDYPAQLALASQLASSIEKGRRGGSDTVRDTAPCTRTPRPPVYALNATFHTSRPKKIWITG